VVVDDGRRRGASVAVALMRENHRRRRRRPPSIRKKYKRSDNRLGFLLSRVGGLQLLGYGPLTGSLFFLLLFFSFIFCFLFSFLTQIFYFDLQVLNWLLRLQDFQFEITYQI
jgi:hypothetical protein